MRLLGLFIGLVAIIAMTYGAWIAIAKPVMDSSDLLIVGVASMVLSQLAAKLAEFIDRHGRRQE